jgi:regulator of RNase E activity RraA
MLTDVTERIVKYILKNRVSTTEVADCLGKSGVIPGVKAVNARIFRAGVVRSVYGHSESNWTIHEQCRNIEENEIVVIDGINVGERSLIGELIAKFTLLYRGAAAIVLLGNARDANDLIKNNYPVWCKGFNPVGCFNTDEPLTPEIEQAAAKNRAYYDKSVAVCDDSGVVIIPGDQLTEEFLQKLHDIEYLEDIWFSCIDHYKWDTYDTVCLKKYRDLPGNGLPR